MWLKKRPEIVLALAWLLPGLVHLLLGKRGHAVVFFLCVVGVFVVGDVASDFKGVSYHYHRWAFVAQMGAGAPVLLHLAIAGQPSDEEFRPALGEGGRRISPFYDAGMIYMMIAGLLNVVAIADAVERAVRRPRRGADAAEEGAEEEATREGDEDGGSGD